MYGKSKLSAKQQKLPEALKKAILASKSKPPPKKKKIKRNNYFLHIGHLG